MTYIYVIICIIWIVKILNHYFKTKGELHPVKYSCEKTTINPHLENPENLTIIFRLGQTTK